MDKSARPPAYLFAKTWRALYPKSKLPAIKFIEIGPDSEAEYRFEPISSPQNSSIREELKNRYKVPQGAKIGIIDDFSYSGNSLRTAKRVLSSAFPDSGEISSTAMFERETPWWDNEVVIGVEEYSFNDRIEMKLPHHLVRRPDNRSKGALLFREDLTKIARDIPQFVKPVSNQP